MKRSLAMVATVAIAMRLLRFAWLSSFVLLGAACSSTPDDGAPVASLELGFELADGSPVDEVSYAITGNGIDPMEGVIDTSAPGSTASVEVFGIPPGTQYLVTMTATTIDGERTCEGAVRFDVSAGIATEVHVMLGCKRAPRLGSVRANGKLNVCTDLTKVVASPLQTSIANGLALSAEGSDVEGDPIAYRWRATGGSLSNPSSAVTTYTCEVDGPQTVEVEVSDDGFDQCVDDWTIDVTCVVDPNAVDPAPALEGSSPTAGSRVVSSAWLDLLFAEEVSADALRGFALRCNDGATPISVHRVGGDDRRLVMNPEGDLPYDATCSLRWTGPEGPTSLDFFTFPDGGLADVPYDREDPTRFAPFPDDLWVVPDESSPTGRRLDLPLAGRTIDVVNLVFQLKTAIGELDGFSPLGALVVELSDAPEPTSLPRTPTDSLDPLATVGLFDVDPGSASYGTRIPFELYVRSVAPVSDPSVAEHALILFPSIPLTSTGQYALVVTKRALAEVDRAFQPSPFMESVLDAPSEGEGATVPRLRDILAPALAGLSSASPPVFADDIALVTRFTIRSTNRFPLTPITMREQVQQLPPPAFTIDRIDRNSFDVEAVVYGTWEAPEWRDGDSIARDADGLPMVVETRPVPFILAIPRSARDIPAPVTMYQHGNPGSAEAEVPGQANRYLAEKGHAVIGFTDNLNREVGSDGQLQQIAILSPLVLSGVLPDFDLQTTGEQLSFLRFIRELEDLDVVPFGAPDGQPDLDLGLPLTYDGISEGANKGQGFVPYAPEIAAAALIVGGARRGEILFYQDEIPPDGIGTPLLNAVSLFAPNIRPLDLWIGLSLYQLAIDPADPQNHVSFMYANPLEVGGTLKKPSVLVQEGIADLLVPNNATRSLVYALSATPLIQPVAQPVPYLMRAEAPLTGNVDAQTTSAYAQYVPGSVAGLAVTPGCEFLNNGHFCPQIAPVALDQRYRFFESALYDEAPTIDVGQGPIDLCNPGPDCDDGDPCTRDFCVPEDGSCANTATTGPACRVDGQDGICERGACTPIEMCSMLDPALESASAMLDCRFLGIPIELTASVAAEALGPISPGPIDYTIQTSIGLLPQAVELLSLLERFVPVQQFSGVVESTLGSVEPNPIMTEQPDELCVLALVDDGSSVGLASEPVAATWSLQESATEQGLTLRDVELGLTVGPFDETLTTAGPDPTCTWNPAPPTLVFARQ